MSDADETDDRIDDTLLVLGGMAVLYSAWTTNRIYRLLADRSRADHNGGERVTIEPKGPPWP